MPELRRPYDHRTHRGSRRVHSTHRMSESMPRSRHFSSDLELQAWKATKCKKPAEEVDMAASKHPHLGVLPARLTLQVRAVSSTPAIDHGCCVLEAPTLKEGQFQQGGLPQLDAPDSDASAGGMTTLWSQLAVM